MNKPLPASRLRGKLILLGLLLYVLFLILSVPVAGLIRFMPEDSPLQLRQASGSPWHGSVQAITWKVDNEKIELGTLTWRWVPAELLHGHLSFNFELKHAPYQLNGRILLDGRGQTLKEVRGDLNAVLLGFASRPMSLLQPQGNLAIDIPYLRINPKKIHGEAHINWLNARSSLVPAPLGDYRANLTSTPDGRRARITVQTLQGALTINGHIDYSYSQGLDGKLMLTPPSDARNTLYLPALSLLGRPNANGAWPLILSAPGRK